MEAMAIAPLLGINGALVVLPPPVGGSVSIVGFGNVIALTGRLNWRLLGELPRLLLLALPTRSGEAPLPSSVCDAVPFNVLGSVCVAISAWAAMTECDLPERGVVIAVLDFRFPPRDEGGDPVMSVLPLLSDLALLGIPFKISH